MPLDVGLKRGIVIEGRVTDQKSGKPLKAFVEYNAYSDNPHIADAPGFDRSDFWGAIRPKPMDLIAWSDFPVAD